MTSFDRRLMPVLVGLAVVGIASASLRYLVPHDLHVAITKPLFGDYATQQLAVLREQPLAEHSHRLGGSLYFLLGLFQFAPGARRRWPRAHHWSGRLFVTLALLAGVSGAALSATRPFADGERAPSFLFAALLIVFTLEGVRRARAGDQEGHREFMLRGFAIGLGISTIRLFAVALTVATDLPTRSIVAPTFWAGWLVSIAAAEGWIRLQRLRTHTFANAAHRS